MKTIIFFTTLLIFLHTTAYHMIGTEAKVGAPDAVLDVDGKPVLSQYIYDVLPALKGPTSINSRQLGNKNCTFGVSLELRGVGLPVAFYQYLPYAVPGYAIRESTDTNIMFATSVGCNSSGVWKVDRQDPSTGQNFIVTDGVFYSGSANNWFWIEKIECPLLPDNHCYKFRYCSQPLIPCLRCPLNCTDLAFVNNNGAGPLGFLALAEASYPFKFSKYEGHAERY